MRSIVLSLAVVAVAACATTHPATPAPDAITPDEYAIYRRVLEDSLADEPVFVIAMAGAVQGADPIASLTEDRELQVAFTAASRLRAVSATDLRVPRARVIADPGFAGWPTPLGEQERRWEQLRAQYGAHATFVHFSRVGFSRDRTRAIVIYSARSGPACNFGLFSAVYQRERGRWEPVANSASFC